MIFHDCDENIVSYDNSPISWRVSAYVIIKKDDSILLIKNKEEKLYDIPGGGIEFDESVEEALCREAMEEAGIQITIGDFLYLAQDYFYHKKQEKFYKTIQLFYNAELLGEIGEATDPRTEYVGFVKLSELGKYPLPSAVKNALQVI